MESMLSRVKDKFEDYSWVDDPSTAFKLQFLVGFLIAAFDA
jgi:hypothetical protein